LRSKTPDKVCTSRSCGLLGCNVEPSMELVRLPHVFVSSACRYTPAAISSMWFHRVSKTAVVLSELLLVNSWHLRGMCVLRCVLRCLLVPLVVDLSLSRQVLTCAPCRRFVFIETPVTLLLSHHSRLGIMIERYSGSRIVMFRTEGQVFPNERYLRSKLDHKYQFPKRKN